MTKKKMKPIKQYSELNFFTKLKELFFNPKNFFKLIKSEKDIKSAFLLSLLSYSIFLIWYVKIVLNSINLEARNHIISSLPVTNWTNLFILFAIIGFLTFFLIAYFLKVFSNLMGSKNDFKDFYNIIVYSYTPYGVFGFIPLVPLWTLVLDIIGIKSLTKFSTLKSIGAFLLATISS